MADIRSPLASSAAPLPTAARPAGGRSEAVRAAQKAFFEAALSGAATAPAGQVKGAPSTATASARPDGPAPQRPLRPGSLLDIKV